jgi:hypothetical protein
VRSDLVAGQRHPQSVRAHLRPEWAAVSVGRRNVLLAGPEAVVDQTLAAMVPQLTEPVRLFNPLTETSLPTITDGTLVLIEVAELNPRQQLQLLDWLDGFQLRRHVQVISTTSKALFGLVESGAFSADLYYRLNVVRLDLDVALEQP